MNDEKNITLSQIIRAPKQDVQFGDWKSGAIPKAQFPLTRSKLSLGRGWKWRVVTFNAVGQSFVCLVALSTEKESYRAMLGLKDGQTLKVICHHELHTDHWNWHCHMIYGNVLETFSGVLRDKNRMKPWPSFNKDECTVPFEVSKESALSIAAARFRFQDSDGFL